MPEEAEVIKRSVLERIADVDSTTAYAWGGVLATTYTIFTVCVAASLLYRFGRPTAAEFSAFAMACNSGIHAILAGYASAPAPPDVGNAEVQADRQRIADRVEGIRTNAAAVSFLVTALLFFLDYKLSLSWQELCAFSLVLAAFIATPIVVAMLVKPGSDRTRQVLFSSLALAWISAAIWFCMQLVQ